MTDSDDKTLAGEYVLGLLEGAAQLDAERRLASDPTFAGAVEAWRVSFGAFDDTAELQPASDELWRRIEAGVPAVAGARRASPQPGPGSGTISPRFGPPRSALRLRRSFFGGPRLWDPRGHAAADDGRSAARRHARRRRGARFRRRARRARADRQHQRAAGPGAGSVDAAAAAARPGIGRPDEPGANTGSFRSRICRRLGRISCSKSRSNPPPAHPQDGRPARCCSRATPRLRFRLDWRTREARLTPKD